MNVDGVPIALTGEYEGDTPYMANDAATVLMILMDAYPGHAWHVRCAGGVFYIRYVVEGMNKPWGMVVKFRDVQHDWKVLKHEVIMMAGEWLERAGLARGVADGTETVHIEGVPLRDQPYRNSVADPVLVGSDGMPVREVLRRQVAKEMDGG